MSLTFLSDGIGASLGDSLALAEPLLLSGDVWYVSSVSGFDAGGTRGQDRTQPLATIGQALTNCATDDIIVLLADHSQTIASTQTISKAGLTIVGEGSASGNPTATFTGNLSGAMFNVTAARVQFRSVKFAHGLQANPISRVLAAGDDFALRNCYIECGQYDNAAFVLASAQRFLSRSNTYTSVGVSPSAGQPYQAIRSSGSLTGLTIEGDTFSGGVSGWASQLAVDLSNAAITSLRIEGISMLLGSDMKLNASSTGYVNVATSTGGSRTRW